ncbi:OmcA/MtrC family decaheme c-type cytochrome [Photobacterium sp. DA100]|uniref:OmcA/MtrC family decaheme c-type cytochrome n=1 Tax=Photobacterium sp. DA100 TaxID=3027472 RepID=UPI002478642C|nr:OmcA/MtrC family decaheme c-type cytochrome [Photobacterium sp. DA100]WEM43603.1 OmcA/MtrC family decaheme c-type cytochrome [Photobacterium sp. DA100]
MIVIRFILAFICICLIQACDNQGSDQNSPPPDPNDISIDAQTPVLNENGLLSVEFTATDGTGAPFELDPESGLSFAVLKVSEGRSTGDNSFWQTFIFGSQSPAADAKPNFESSGVFEVLAAGSYRYTFSVDVTQVVDPAQLSAEPAPAEAAVIEWEPDVLHRFAIRYGDALSDIPVINYTLDWVPSGGSAPLSRDILDNSSCTTCHMGEAPFHGTRAPANRVEPQICSACHNDSNPNSTRRSLAVIVHDKHGNVFEIPDEGGEEAEPELVGSPYPQDARNCDTCHKDVSDTTADADNWFNHPTAEACGACHTVRNSHSSAFPSNDRCEGCHGVDAGGRSVQSVHGGRLAAMQAGRDTLELAINSARYSDPDFEIEITLTRNGEGVASFADIAPFIRHGSAYLLVNWNNGNGLEISYTANRVRINMTEECSAMGDGQFLCKKAFPNGETALKPTAGSVLVVTNAEMPLCTDRKAEQPALIACDDSSLENDRDTEYLLAANAVWAAFDIGGGAVNEKTAIGADLASCNGCHKDLTVHLYGPAGQAHSAKDFEQCASCHNATRAAFYPGIPGDLKYHVHSFHGFGSQRSGESSYPGNLANCEACHTASQYNLPNQANIRPSVASVAAGDARENKFFSPALVVCGSCHLASNLGDVNPDSPAEGDGAISHMLRNGAVFAADSAADATGSEQCATCHSVGQDVGVDVVHDVYRFRQ